MTARTPGGKPAEYWLELQNMEIWEIDEKPASHRECIHLIDFKEVERLIEALAMCMKNMEYNLEQWQKISAGFKHLEAWQRTNEALNTLKEMGLSK